MGLWKMKFIYLLIQHKYKNNEAVPKHPGGNNYEKGAISKIWHQSQFSVHYLDWIMLKYSAFGNESPTCTKHSDFGSESACHRNHPHLIWLALAHAGTHSVHPEIRVHLIRTHSGVRIHHLGHGHCPDPKMQAQNADVPKEKPDPSGKQHPPHLLVFRSIEHNLSWSSTLRDVLH